MIYIKAYKVTIEPVTFTNDFSSKKLEITCKRLKIDKIVEDLYGIKVNEISENNGHFFVKAGYTCFDVSIELLK